VGAGVLPLLIAVFFSNDKYDFMSGGIILYRLAGAMGLMVLLSLQRGKNPAAGDNWLGACSWAALVIAAAMAAKTYIGIDTNIYSSFTHAGISDNNDVMGLFRGSDGFLATLAVCALAADSRKIIKSSILGILGTLAGIYIILVSASKTSMIASGCAILISVLLMPTRRSLVRISALTVALALLIGAIGISRARNSVSLNSIRFLESKGESHATLDDRVQSKWLLGLNAIALHPELLLGIATSSAMPVADISTYQATFYHDEYIAVLMLGGIWSVVPYAAGVCALFLVLWRGRKGTAVQRFALLSFFAGVIQGVTVSFFSPGLLFCPVVAMLCGTFGFGAGAPKVYGLARWQPFPADIQTVQAVSRRPLRS
jgi:hypothetical protein